MAMKKFEILNVICNNCNLTSKEILVAHYFVYKSNKEGSCYPAVNTIAKHCGVSERTIQRATKKLQERGYILIIERKHNGRQTSNEYRLNINVADNNFRVIEEERVNIQIEIEELPSPMKSVSLEELLVVDEIYDAELLTNDNAQEEQQIIDDVVIENSFENNSQIEIASVKVDNCLTITTSGHSVVGNINENPLIYKDIINLSILIWLANRQFYLSGNLFYGYSFVKIQAILKFQFKLILHRSNIFLSGSGVPP